MHIDLNQFFAAATRLLEPDLIGKPLIIGSISVGLKLFESIPNIDVIVLEFIW